MSASGVGLFQDDVAVDVRREYLELLADGVSDAAAQATMVREWREAIADYDDGPVFWLALAATQWEYGRLQPRVKSRALQIIEKGTGIGRWTDAGLAKKRQAVLTQLKKKLLAPLPKKRTPRPRAVEDPPSFTVASPDNQAEAEACLLGKEAGRLKSQVFVTMKVKRAQGGGSVFVVFCAHTAIQLTWLDKDTLRIAYPRDAEVTQRRTTNFYCGRTIVVRYRRV